ncbi:MAG: aminotransferase class I/II-fold pyridoxal phosphate-dependent enzyme [Planctomycetes bacterium]|nr:aminotransferase class I/II-fold pyridoxal phosphate-dependent enzyme [Planctomycetota bacterium]
MSFRKIDYLTWARTFMGRSRYDLARSNVKAVTKEEIELTLDQIDVSIPDPQGNEDLRQLLAKRYGVPASCVFITNGATMGLFLACAATIDRNDEVLLESPNYEPLYRIPMQFGANLKMIERRFDRGWQIDLEELERRVSRSTRAIVLTNMHNPSGVATNPEKLRTIGQIARACGARVIVSEVYLDNVFASGHKPAATYGDHMVSLGSMSKVYGLGSLRVGWIVGSEEVIDRLKTIFDYVAGGLPGPTQSIALAALKKSDVLLARCRDIVQRNIKAVSEWIKKHEDTTWIEPEGGTVGMLKLPPHVEALGLATLLREKYSTLVVPGDFFWVKGFIRLSLGVDEEVVRIGLKNLGSAIEQMRSPQR